MTRYSDAALLKGDYAHLAAEMRAGNRAAPVQKDWDSAACDNSAEETAQEVAKHIFAFQQSLDAEKEQLEILTYSAAGQMKVIAIHPGDGDVLRLDGILVPQNQPASVVIHASLLSLTFVRVPLSDNDDEKDDGLKIGFVIFDELKERQKARYTKSGKRKTKKIDLTKPFGLPPAPNRVPSKEPARQGSEKTPGKTSRKK